jgi:inosine/xanthosine triphosphate pyrophosphatase family protein
MKITIVTLCRDDMGEYFVGAVKGQVSQEQRQKIADGFDAALWPDDADPDADEQDQVYFAEVELHEKVEDLTAIRSYLI